MTTTNSDHLALSETVPPESASEPTIPAASEQPEADADPAADAVATSTSKENNNVDDDDDLEEGELKDDDDSDDDEVDGPIVPMTTQQPARLLPVSSSGVGGQYDVMQLEPGSAMGQPLGPEADEQGPKKKKKKRVVRRVKKMVKVIKKVPKKKADQLQPQQQQQQLPPRQDKQGQQPLLPQQPMLAQNQTSQQQQQQQQPQPLENNQNIANSQRLLPHIQSNNTSTSVNLSSNSSATQAQPTPLLPAASQQTPSTITDSLLEQQILMLQEMQRQQQQPAPQQHQPLPFNQPANQQHAQMLRAAATDKDLRYMQPPYLFAGPNMNLMQPNQHHIQPFISQGNPVNMNQPMPFITTMPNINTLAPASMMTSTNLLNSMANSGMQPVGMLSQNDGLTPMMQQQLHLISQQNQSLPQQQGATVLPQAQPSHLQYQSQNMQQQQPQTIQPINQDQPQADTTPSSPDDEGGKSSYEAISKMLTLLRNSANLSDNSETNNQTQDNPAGDSDQGKGSSEFEYSLIPVLVQGIDYTKYKLLSQYEPKFKNDPRLNQQA